MAEKSARSKETDTDMSVEQVKEQIIQLGKKKGSLTYDTISEMLGNFDLDAEQMDEFYEHLTELGIQLLEDEEDEDLTDDPDLSDLEKEEEFDLNDLSVPPGEHLNHLNQTLLPSPDHSNPDHRSNLHPLHLPKAGFPILSDVRKTHPFALHPNRNCRAFQRLYHK